MKIAELRKKRAELIVQARKLVDTAEKEDSREFTEEETSKYDLLMDESFKLKQKIEREEQLQELEKEREELERTQGVTSGTDLNPENRKVEHKPTASPEYREAFNGWLRGGSQAVTSEQASMLVTESRALQSDLDVSGGYLVPPVEMVSEIIKGVDDMTFIRMLATKYTVTQAAGLGAASLDADPADPTWTSELAIGTEDSTMAFGKRELHPHPLAKYIKISNKLVRQVPNIESYVRDRLSYKFGIAHEKAFLTGSGAQQPLGLFTASNDGIGTGRDVSTGNTSSSVTFDGLLEAKFSLKGQYWNRSAWLFHRDAVKQIAKLKDGDGQYLWRESVRAGEPDMVLGRPVYMSEYVPNTFTTGKYVGMIGDYSLYWVVDALTMTFQRLVELYAATNQVAIIGRWETDGMPVLAEAFARVKLG